MELVSWFKQAEQGNPVGGQGDRRDGGEEGALARQSASLGAAPPFFQMGAVQCPYIPGGFLGVTSTKPPGHRPAKTSRIELRATEDDRDLLDRAAAALGTDRSSFLLYQGRLAAQRVLADRQHVLLDADAQQEWERINSRPARSLPGLTRLLERPSPFAKPAADQPQP
jgi:uncharacterized protein (DUF1778 family)